MFVDLQPLKTLYEEILQTQAVSEKQLQDLQELIKALQTLRTEYDKVDNNLTENAKLLTTILQKADIIYKNIEAFETKTNKNLQRLQEELKSTINNITEQLQSDLDSVLYLTKDKLQAREQELHKLISNYNNFASNAQSFWQQQKELAETELNELQEQIQTKTQEIFEELEQKTFLQRWGAVFGAFAIGIAISFIFLIPTIKAKMQLSKIVQVVKIKDPQAQKTIANLNNKIENLQKENKELKSKIDYLQAYEIPDDWRFTCDTKTNKHNCIGVPAKFVTEDTYEGKDYYFINLPH